MSFEFRGQSGIYRGLTPGKLQWFVAGLSGMDHEEVRKAKLLFVRN